MIIFDLDGTLADCEHRRHFVDLKKAEEKGICEEDVYCDMGGYQSHGWFYTNDPDRRWKPNWSAFYEACDKDTPIEPVINILDGIYFNSKDEKFFLQNVQIWSCRCESVREKTIEWLNKHILFEGIAKKMTVKMRPVGDSTPDDVLKERWFDEYNLNLYPPLIPCSDNVMDGFTYKRNDPVEMVFDDRKKVVEMWRRRGIFVFDVSQGKGNF